MDERTYRVIPFERQPSRGVSRCRMLGTTYGVERVGTWWAVVECRTTVDAVKRRVIARMATEGMAERMARDLIAQNLGIVADSTHG